jgi:hypothetical protein
MTKTILAFLGSAAPTAATAVRFRRRNKRRQVFM